eukprot:g25208.t1
MQLITGYERWDKAADVWQYNAKRSAFKMDLANVAEAALHVMEASPTLIAGGPPCQDYSTAGKRVLGKNAALTQAFAMIIALVRPQWFVFENTPRAPLSINYRQARDIWKRAGYGLTEHTVVASQYGTAQNRRRFLCVGRLGEQDQFLLSSLVAAASKDLVTVRSILDPDRYPDDAELMRCDGYFVRPFTGGRGVFSLDEPAPTIIRSSTGKPNKTYRDNPHPKDHIHYDEAFQLTTHQALRIQGFPADFDTGGYRMKNQGKPWSQRDTMQMIANAVPPPLARAVGEVIIAREAGRSIPALDLGFDAFLLKKFPPKATSVPKKVPGKKPSGKRPTLSPYIANIKSRARRARKILDGRTYADLTLELAALENKPDFAALNVRSRSDLRAALRLYHEYASTLPPSKYATKIDKGRNRPAPGGGFGRRPAETLLVGTPVERVVGEPRHAHNWRNHMSKQKKMKPLLLATAADAVRALVIDVNGRASAHTATPRDIVGMTEELEKLREKTLLPKASAVGMRVVVTTEGPSASSYKYAVNGSQAGFVFTKKGWALDRYEKVGVYPKTKRRVQDNAGHLTLFVFAVCDTARETAIYACTGLEYDTPEEVSRGLRGLAIGDNLYDGNASDDLVLDDPQANWLDVDAVEIVADDERIYPARMGCAAEDALRELLYQNAVDAVTGWDGMSVRDLEHSLLRAREYAPLDPNGKPCTYELDEAVRRLARHDQGNTGPHRDDLIAFDRSGHYLAWSDDDFVIVKYLPAMDPDAADAAA